jgi:hypothetical protein
VSWFGRKAFRPIDRTATEARVRSPSIGFQLNRLNRSAGAGFEPATRCVSGICSSRLSYPRTDRLFGDKDRFVRRNTDTQSAPRRPGSHEPGPEAERRTRLMHQTVAERKCFLLARRTFVCSVLHSDGASARIERPGRGRSAIIKQNRRRERSDRARRRPRLALSIAASERSSRLRERCGRRVPGESSRAPRRHQPCPPGYRSI